MSHLTPDAEDLVDMKGMKVPRQQHRYSGRTAMRANINVHEPKQEQDEEGILSYSMEGISPLKDATVFNTAWAGGWNSNQSVFKFQSHTGGALKQASNGQCLIKSTVTDKNWSDISESKSVSTNFEGFPLYHLFGSEELSARADAIQEKATAAYIALNEADVEKLGLQASDGVSVLVDGINCGSVPYIIRSSIAPGSVGVSVGLQGLDITNVAHSALSIEKDSSWSAPDNWRMNNIIVSDKGAI